MNTNKITTNRFYVWSIPDSNRSHLSNVLLLLINFFQMLNASFHVRTFLHYYIKSISLIFLHLINILCVLFLLASQEAVDVVLKVNHNAYSLISSASASLGASRPALPFIPGSGDVNTLFGYSVDVGST